LKELNTAQKQKIIIPLEKGKEKKKKVFAEQTALL
jgi:hypothetical protein